MVNYLGHHKPAIMSKRSQDSKEESASSREFAKQQHSIETVRSILLREDREYTQSEIAELQEQVAKISAELERLEQVKADSATLVPSIQEELSEITRTAITADRIDMAEAIGPIISEATKVQVRESRDEMAQAIGPIIGEATRIQIRESKEEMATALSPIMMGAINRSIREAMRDLQRQIDARLSQTATNNTLVKRLYYRSQGVDSGAASMRQALPFSIRDVFLIQNQSGLLLAHHTNREVSSDSDLVSAMLTAIRDFVGDAFADDSGARGDLQEVQYGEQQIILENGQEVYVAMVFDGTVPPELHTRMRQFLSELELQDGTALASYDGDPETIRDYKPRLGAFSAEIIETPILTDPVPRDISRLFKLVGGCLGLSLLTFLCFASIFTYKLLPVAFGNNTVAAIVTNVPVATATATTEPTPTLAPTIVPTAEPSATPAPTQTAEPSATPLPTSTPSSTPEPTQTLRPTFTPQPTETPIPTATFSPPRAYSLNAYYTRSEPSINSANGFIITEGTQATIIAVQGSWFLLEWGEDPVLQGWVQEAWIARPDRIPLEIVTPQAP